MASNNNDKNEPIEIIFNNDDTVELVDGETKIKLTKGLSEVIQNYECYKSNVLYVLATNRLIEFGDIKSQTENIDYEKIGMDFLYTIKENINLESLCVDLERLNDDLLNYKEISKECITFLKQEKDKPNQITDTKKYKKHKITAWIIMDYILNIFKNEDCNQTKIINDLIDKDNDLTKSNKKSLSVSMSNICKQMQKEYDLITLEPIKNKKGENTQKKSIQATTLGKICFNHIKKLNSD